MITETIELCAYHESGRVAYAYQCGYSCESILLSEEDSGAGVSKLNAGADGEAVQLILNNKQQAASTATNEKAIAVARKLMKIYCAATCAEIFFREEKQIGGQTEIEIPGQDIKYINLIQAFLKNNVPNHPADYPSQIIKQIFGELKQDDNWNLIETLAAAILKTEEKKITRFSIEDAVMKAGFKPQRKQAIGLNDFDMTVREDNTKRKNTASSESYAALEEEKQLDSTLKNFLRLIKRELNEEELNASVDYLKQIFNRDK